MNIEEFKEYQAEELSALIRRDLLEIISKDYSAEYVASLLDEFAPSNIKVTSRKQNIFVAVEDGHIVGTASLAQYATPETPKYYGTSVFVAPESHGKGIGRQLMGELLKRAEHLQSVRLFQEAFNPASFGLYYSHQFMPVADLLDVFVDPREGNRTDPCSKVREATADDLDAASRYDAPRSKLDRRTDFAYYAKWGKVFIYQHQSTVRGVLACLPGSRSVQLGTLVADGAEEAYSLLQHAIGVFCKQQCQTRVMARDDVLVRGLQMASASTICGCPRRISMVFLMRL